MASVNGVEIDLMPNDGMRKEAQRYRDWKADGEGGGTDVARTRATQILSGNELSPDTVVTMSAWFARHEVDKQGKGFSPGEEGYPSNGRVAWAAWGGDAGKSWSDARSKRIKKLVKVDNLLAIMVKNSQLLWSKNRNERHLTLLKQVISSLGTLLVVEQKAKNKS